MHDFQELCQTVFHMMLCFSLLSYELMYEQTIIRFGFHDVRKNQGYLPSRRPRMIRNTYLGLDYSGYHKNPAQLIEQNRTRNQSNSIEPSRSDCFSIVVYNARLYLFDMQLLLVFLSIPANELLIKSRDNCCNKSNNSQRKCI